MRAVKPVIWMALGSVLTLIAPPLVTKAATFAHLISDYGWGEGVDALQRRLAGRDDRTVVWESGAPETEGLSKDTLLSLQLALAECQTTAFLVARHGKLVHEWYAPGHPATQRQGVAAMAKAVVGTMALLTLANDGVVGLDDPASEYIPRWRDRTDVRAITLHQLASHASGLDDVVFPPLDDADIAFQGQPAWKKQYFLNPDQRFTLALTTAPLLFPPETEYRYSGVGYYVLAYALASGLKAGPGEDLRHWLARVYRSAGIPASAWQISYGDGYGQDGLVLYAIGSGASLTPRAIARMGQYVLDHRDEPTFSPLTARLIRTSTSRDGGSTRQRGIIPGAVPHFGWWGNEDHTWRSLPQDAMMGFGAGGQVLLIVPSLELVVVRLGPSLCEEDPAPETLLERRLFAPLARSLQ